MEQIKLLIMEDLKFVLKENQIKDPLLELSVTKVWGIGDVNRISEEQFSSSIKCWVGTRMKEKRLLDMKEKEFECRQEAKKNRNVAKSWPQNFDEWIWTKIFNS